MTNPAETQPTTSEVINEPPEAATAKQAEQEPKNHLAVIAEVEEKTGWNYRPKQIEIVVETITSLENSPDRQTVMDILCAIADQLGVKLRNFPDQYLPAVTEQMWKELNETKSAKKAEPVAQDESEVDMLPAMRASDAADSPVIGFRPIGTPEDKDKIGGSTTAPGEPMDEIV